MAVDYKSKFEEYRKYSLCFICYKNWNNKIFQRAMFPSFSTKIEKLKQDKKNLLEKIEKYNEYLINEKDKTNDKILKQEIDYILVKHKLLKDTFDIEANKLNPDYKIESSYPDYDYFSKKIYWITKSEIEEIWDLPCKMWFDKIKISLEKFNNLVEKAKTMLPWADIKVGDFANFSVSWNTIKIPKKDSYNIQEVITLFFHEFSHHIRYVNMKRNLWFYYQFSTNHELEEWIALYNEYYYGNQIINYGKYYPYYHKVYNVLMQKLSPEEKFNKMYEILSCKWFSKEKVQKYYWRFYRFVPLHGEDFIFKEAIYYKSYQRVKEYLSKWISLDYLMASKWNKQTIDYFLKWKKLNNFDHKWFFEAMVKGIKKEFKL